MKNSQEDDDIGPYIKSKGLKTREDIDVHLRCSSDKQDDQRLTNVSAERLGDVEDGEIFDIMYSLIKDNTTGKVRLTNLEIQVKSLSTNFIKNSMCQLPNGTYICFTHVGVILKLDGFKRIGRHAKNNGHPKREPY